MHRFREFLALLMLLGGHVSVADAEAGREPRQARVPLEVVPGTLAICRLVADAPIPAWASAPGPFLTISRTSDELSITVAQDLVPVGTRCERDYRAIRVRGTLPPDLVGILLSMAQPLAAAGLSIFAISTYDTDYVLVKARDLAAAVEALRGAGHDFEPGRPNM